jgi:TRAP-type C4-dicarboxylate transport system permease small subunit
VIERLWQQTQRLAAWFVIAAGGMLLAAAIIVTVEVLLRKGFAAVFGWSIVFSGSDEISAYLFAVATAWSLPYALVHRGHIRIDVLYSRLGDRGRCLLDLFALLVMLGFSLVMFERAWDLASNSLIDNIRSNTPLRIPLAWAQIPWALGIGLFCIAMILALSRSLKAIANRDYAQLHATAGIPSQDEEVRQEIKDLGLGNR